MFESVRADSKVYLQESVTCLWMQHIPLPFHVALLLYDSSMQFGTALYSYSFFGVP